MRDSEKILAAYDTMRSAMLKLSVLITPPNNPFADEMQKIARDAISDANKILFPDYDYEVRQDRRGREVLVKVKKNFVYEQG